MLTAMVKKLDERIRSGVFRGSRAVAVGAVTEHQLRSTRFTRLLRDVYVTSDQRVTHELLCRAAALIVPAGAALTGRSAAVIRGVALAGRWDPVEIAVVQKDRFGPIQGIVVRRLSSGPLEQISCRGLQVVSCSRMVFDLGVRSRLSDAVADLDQVLRADVLDTEAAERYLAASRERNVRRARLAWKLADGRAESRPESTLRVLLVLAGLRPVPQFEVWDDAGFVARVDLGFPERRVAVEYDGAWHATESQLRRDRRRLNRLREAGWAVVFVTADMLREDPQTIVRSVRAALTNHDHRRDLAAYRAL
jgi:very-short-patch-repair endonuclease